MHVYTVAVVLLLLRSFGQTLRIPEDYLRLRQTIIEEEIKQSLGGSLVLDKDELQANEIIMKWKRKEVDEKFHEPRHEDFWQRADKSKVYEVIRKMPKGALLHIHSSAMLDVDSLIELTHEYESNLYACYHTDLKLLFSESVPPRSCAVSWTLLSDLRNNSGDTQAFDTELRERLCLSCASSKYPNENIHDVWKRLEEVHSAVSSILSFRPVREKYFYRSLQKLYDDNVKYVEIRGSMKRLYELDGTVHHKMYMARLYKNISDEFIKTHPDFIGFKYIVSGMRSFSNEQIRQSIETAQELKREMPEIFAGYDLVGQEDLGRPLVDILPELAAIRNDVDFYFHGGETNWFGTSSDDNLVDAILMGTKRIGHGYALIKHPGLMSIVKQRDIAIEVNVVSNYVLCLVSDMRNHPLATYLALDMPVVLSSDDPGTFFTEPLSHDFYVAFVDVASRYYDLRMLKTLALNSIKYSSLDDEGKEKMLKVFNEDWSKFIRELILMGDADDGDINDSDS